MPKLLRNVLAFLAGLILGGAVNMGLIVLSPSIIPPPAGVDVTDVESLSRSIHLFEPRHFVMPFLAHALGTLAGALVAYLIAVTHKLPIALAIGLLSLVGGVAASFMIPAPAWFIALDLIGAYVPMAWLGARLGALVRGTSQVPNHVRTLLVVFTIAALPWQAEAQTQRVFENEHVIAWRLVSGGERTEPLVRDRRLPGVIVALVDGAVRIIDDVNTVTTRDVAPASGVVLIAIKDYPRDRLEIPPGMIPAFPREGVRRVVENDSVVVWAVTWAKGLKTPLHFHDKDVVAVYLDPGTVRSIASNGETTATPRLAGDTVFNPRGRVHIEECIDGPRRDIIIELK